MRDELFALPCRFLLGQAHCLSRELTDAMGGSEMTQFGRALVELNIEIPPPGVGQNLQDHPLSGCLWEASEVPDSTSVFTQAIALWKSAPAKLTPDIAAYPIARPLATENGGARPKSMVWGIRSAALQPRSGGLLLLTGPNASDGMRIEPNLLSDTMDRTAALTALKFCRELGRSPFSASIRWSRTGTRVPRR